jgi:hypothetical protein
VNTGAAGDLSRWDHAKWLQKRLGDARRREAELESALADLVDAAESRVPGDAALWDAAVQEAREVLQREVPDIEKEREA